MHCSLVNYSLLCSLMNYIFFYFPALHCSLVNFSIWHFSVMHFFHDCYAPFEAVTQTWKKKHFFVNSEILETHIWRGETRKLWQIWNCDKLVNQIFNLNAFFFLLLTGATWYYHTIYLVFRYFASFTDYEDDIFEVISYFHIQGYKFGGKINKFWQKIFKNLNSTEFMEFVFSRSAVTALQPSTLKFIIFPCTALKFSTL